MRVALMVVGVLILSAPLEAANWPEWRGPSRDGVTTEENVPLKWSATENVKWKVALPGPGNSTPIVWEDKVFVTQSIEDEAKRSLLCFDRRNGRLLWERGTVYAEKEQSHETNPQCSASPATDGERVVAWFGSAGLFCYDLDGKELWRRDLGKHVHEWGYAASPVVHEDRVFLNFGPGENSFLIALDKKTGKELWRVDIVERHYKERKDGFAGQNKGIIGSWSTPIMIKSGDHSELVITVPDRMTALDPKTGKEVWFVKGLNPLIYTSPVYGEGVIVANGGFGGPDLVVKPGGQGDATGTHRLWEGGRTANRLGSAVIKDGYFYLVGMPGIAECLELKTGRKVWEERVRGKGAKNDSWSSMVLAGDRIYMANQSGEVIVLRASPKFEVLQVNSVGNEMCNASPVISGGDLFLRTHKNLWCFGTTIKTASR